LVTPRCSDSDTKVPEGQVVIRDFGGFVINEDPACGVPQPTGIRGGIAGYR
jgi:hypothetical protein